MWLPNRHPFRRGATPAWLALVLAISSYYGHLKRIDDAMRSAWNSVTTNTQGLSVLLTLLTTWIILSMYWPRPKLWAYQLVGYEPKPKPKPVPERVTALEQSIVDLEGASKDSK